MPAEAAWSKERTAIVTGGGSGIGVAISERLAAEGAAVAVWDRNGETAAATAKQIEAAGGVALGIEVDVRDCARIHEAVSAVERELGAPTILVNNAGISPFRRFLDVAPEELDRVLDVNLKGTFYCCQAVVPHMIAAGWGRIVNIASSSAQTGSPGQSHYVASKAGVIGLTMCLATELGPEGITVNCVPPSVVDTPSLRQAEREGFLGKEGVALQDRILPVRRVGLPEDIASAVAYFVRDESSYVTGQVLGVNGGRVVG